MFMISTVFQLILAQNEEKDKFMKTYSNYYNNNSTIAFEK